MPLGILDTGIGRTETTTQDMPHGKHDRSDSKHESRCLSWSSDTPQASAEKQSDNRHEYHNLRKNEMQESRRPQEPWEVNLETNGIRAMIDKLRWPMVSARIYAERTSVSLVSANISWAKSAQESPERLDEGKRTTREPTICRENTARSSSGHVVVLASAPRKLVALTWGRCRGS